MWHLLESNGFWRASKTRLTGLGRIFSPSALTVLCLLGVAAISFATPDVPALDESGDPTASEILQKYLDAKVHTHELLGASMEVEITADVPKLKENGKLRALKVISRVGQVTYRA